jgi:hypothetical protein
VRDTAIADRCIRDVIVWCSSKKIVSIWFDPKVVI